MIKKSKNKGTFIHGIAASEHLDSSGERIKIEGVDISSLTKDGVFNLEHGGKEASQIVGKILEAKKIIKKSDCTNDHHRYFWDKVRMPFLYVAGELLDGVGHSGAKDIAAMVKYDAQSDSSKTKKLINFSIEGSRLDKKGSNITKCIARKISITITPCNKMCEAEELKDNDTEKNTSADAGFTPNEENFSFIQDLMMEKGERQSSCILMKTNWGEMGLGATIKGEKKISMPAREAVKEHKKLVNVLRSPSHKDDKEEAKKQNKELKEYKRKLSKDKVENLNINLRKEKLKKAYSKRKSSPPPKHKEFYDKISSWDTKEEENRQKNIRRIQDKKDFGKKPKVKKLGRFDSNVRKAIAAGAGMGVPSTKVQGSAIQKDIAFSQYNVAEPSIPQKRGRFTKSEVQKIVTNLSNDAFQRFEKKEELVSFLTNKLPNLKEKEILALAKTVVYYKEKKHEAKLINLMRNYEQKK